MSDNLIHKSNVPTTQVLEIPAQARAREESHALGWMQKAGRYVPEGTEYVSRVT